MGCLFPKAEDLQRFWSNIHDRVDAITEVPETHWRPDDYYDADPKAPDRTYARRGGFLTPVDFPLLDFGISPNTVEATDTTQLLGLLVARRALEDAGYGKGGRDFARDRTSVILGVTGTLELVVPLATRLGHPAWRRALAEAGVDRETADDVVRRIADSYVGWQEASFPGLLGNVAAGRIANKLDLGGANCVVDAACASSLGAVNVALHELASGRCDVALSGGLDTFNDIFMYMCFSKTPALSPSGDARPFAAAGDGTILGEGLGILVLKRLADAERDGDRIYAVIRSMGSSSDGGGQAIYAPKAEGQVKALRRAYEQAGVDPTSIELIEAHGTGTKVGDGIEVEALEEVFRAAGASPRSCALGSVKSQIGHTKAAAGAAGLVKAALALHHKVLPPTIKVDRPLDRLAAADSPFYVNAESRPWVGGSVPRRAAVSAFGFGGSNFHCLLEEARPDRPSIDWGGDVQILAYSADDEQALAQTLPSWSSETPWAEVRAEGLRSRAAFRFDHAVRLAVVARRGDDPAVVMSEARAKLSGKAVKPSSRVFVGRGAVEGKLAFVFPGQGSQYIGMGRELACRFPRMLAALELVDRETSETLGGERLSDRIFPPTTFDADQRRRDDETLRDTRRAQPAIGAVSLGMLGILEDFGVRPEMVGGHSFGELSALHAAGRFEARTLARLAAVRGDLMGRQGDGPDAGSMLAVFATEETLARSIREHSLDVVIANKNAPTQCVLSGPAAEIDRAEEVLRAAGVRAKRLPVSAAFHSRFVADARRPFREALGLGAIAQGAVRTYANATGEAYPDAPEAAGDLLADQLASPVEFAPMIAAMHRDGARLFVEIGPDARLTGLVGSILEGRDHAALAIDSSREPNGLVGLASVLAAVAVSGRSVDLSRWDEDFTPVQPHGKKLTVPVCGAHPTPKRSIDPPPIRKASAPVPAAVPAPARNGHAPKPTPPSPPRPSFERTMNSPDRHPRPSTNGNGHAHAADLAPPAVTQPRPTPTPASAPSASLLPTPAVQQVHDHLLALQQLAGQTARLHQQFLEGQEVAQRTFQTLLEQHLRPGVGPVSAAAPAPVVSPALPPAPAPAPIRAVEPVRPAAPPAPSPARVEVPAPIVPSVPTPAPVAVIPTPTPEASPVGDALLAVVSEKTGYPADMLDLGMALDADLGIDSIKRVEILSALQERLPGSPTVGPDQLGSIHTLGDIAKLLGAGQPAAAAVTTSIAAAPQSSAVGDALLAVVSEKTGYPADMLDLGMALDADLGIDSIKRVEILSALQERLPGSPTVGPDQLGSIHTLGDIATFLGAGQPASRPEPVAPPSIPVQPAPAPIEIAPVRLERLTPRPRPINRAERRERVPFAADAEIWIVDDQTPLTRAVQTALESKGLRGRIVGLDEQPTGEPGGLIVVAPALPAADLPKRAFRLIRALAPGLRKRGGAALMTVSRLDGAFGLVGLDPAADPVSGALAGLSKTAGHEWPEVSCKAVDVDRGIADLDASAQRIVEELMHKGPSEVGISDRGVIEIALERAEWTTGNHRRQPVLDPGDLVVVTGGARGIAAEAAVALARAYRPRLLLLGRTSLASEAEPAWLASALDEAAVRGAIVKNTPGVTPAKANDQAKLVLARREIAAALHRIREAGGEAVYEAVDVRDREVVRAAVGRARTRFGPVRGLIHAAGVLADRRIEDQTDDQFAQVYDTKVDGLLAVFESLDPAELRAIAAFSSSTARFGRTGQVAYAAANETLNKWCQLQARRLPDCRVVSFNWGPWEGGMVTPSLRTVFEREGLGLIPMAEGSTLVARELQESRENPVEIVVLADPPQTVSGSRAETIEEESFDADLRPAFERVVDVDAFPVLLSHVIDGHAVLPMALIMEWLGEAALHRHPGMVVAGVDDLKLFKGVVLRDHKAVPVSLRAGKGERRDASWVVPVEMRGTLGGGKEIVHARALVTLADRHAEGSRTLSESKLFPLHADQEAIYESILFHGPAMQAIERVEGCDDRMIAARVSTSPAPSEWAVRPLRREWLTDPLAIDAAFQMMVLWCRQRSSSNSLPTAVGSYRQFRRRFPSEGVRVVLVVRHSGDHRAVADIEFLDDDNVPVARIDGYECVVDASLNQAFRRNRLAHSKAAAKPR